MNELVNTPLSGCQGDRDARGQWHQLKLMVYTDLKYKHAEASEEGIVHRDISCDDAWHQSSEYLRR